MEGQDGLAPSVIAVTAAVRGSGSTTTVANLAWILAGAGNRVLVLSLGATGDEVVDFLGPFEAQAGHPPSAELEARVADLTAAPVRTRWFTPHTGSGSLTVIGPTGPPQSGPEPSRGAGAAIRLGIALAASAVDHVLLDGPPGASDQALRELALLADTAVVCFPPRFRAVAEAASLARELRDLAPVGIRIIAAPRVLEPASDAERRQIDGQVVRAFDGLQTDPGGPATAICPLPDRRYGRALAVVLEEPDVGDGLAAAYAGMAGILTRGAVSSLPPVPPAFRRRYRRRTEPVAELPVERMTLAYAAADRLWADWLRDQLEACGASVAPARSPQDIPEGPDAPETVVAILSPDLLGADVWTRVREIAEPDTATSADNHTELIVVEVAGRPSLAPEIGGRLSLAGLSEQDALAVLRARLLMRPAQDAPASGPHETRFPAGEAAPLTGLPPRAADFQGRDTQIEELRDALRGGGGPWTVAGPPGIGKSAVVLEYAHRFARDYDIAWWVSGRDRRSVREGLAALVGRLDQPPAGNAAQAALRALNDPSRRWLLVFDDISDPDVLAGMLPESPTGHVVITTRHGRGDTGHVLLVPPLTEQDGRSLLQRPVPYLPEELAGRLVTALEGSPVALNLAAGWLTMTGRQLTSASVLTEAEAATSAGSQLLAELDQRVGDWPIPPGTTRSAAAALHNTMRTLEQTQTGRLVLRLAELCTVLSAQAVDLQLLASTPMLAQLAAAAGEDADMLLADTRELDRVLWRGVGYRLFDLRWGRGASLRMDSVVRSLLRESMPPDVRANRKDQVLRALAAIAPTDAEEGVTARWEVLADLDRHLGAAGAQDSSDREVRRWFVNQTRWRYLRGDADTWREAVDATTGTLDRWTERDGPADPLRLRLAVQLANLHRSLGDDLAAHRLDRDALAAYERSLGRDHPRTLITRRGLAADLRAFGDFEEAYVEDATAWQGLRAVYGDDHEDTLRAAHNLAISAYFRGEVHTALRLEQQILSRRRELLGWEDPTTWDVAGSVGLYLRELGRYDEAWAALREAQMHMLSRRPESHPDMLRLLCGMAVVQRRQGQADLSLDRNVAALAVYRQLYGEEHRLTQACLLSLAADRHALGDDVNAVRLAQECLEVLLDRSGAGHPFTHLCRVNLGVYQVRAGKVKEGVATGETAYTGLRDRLGDTHPWTLAAQINHAAGLAADGDAAAAARMDAAVRELAEEFLGPRHPYTGIAEANAAEGPRQEVDVDVPQT